jgi:NAD(P) transhydrogenase
VDNRGELGGGSIAAGTVPSKTLRETALALSGLKARQLNGVDLSVNPEVKVADFLRHEQNIKSAFHAMISQAANPHRPDLYSGTAAFVDPHTIRVQRGKNRPLRMQATPTGAELLLQGEKILIATGSSPIRPPLFPFGSPEVYDSDTILQMKFLPERLAVVGAGVIGSEYACTFAAFGVRVELVDAHDGLLPILDREVSHALRASMQRSGVVFHWNAQVEDCRARGSAGVRLYLVSKSAVNVDAVLVAVGRKSSTENLNLAAAGVGLGDRGVIFVNDHLRTNVPHIYAAGDVIGLLKLASTSLEQGRRAARHALGLPVADAASGLLPFGLYTLPEVGMVGQTEEQLRAQGVGYVVGRADYWNNPRGRLIGEKEGFLKLLFRREDMRLVGAHLLGEQAVEIIHVGLMAMQSAGTAETLAETCFIAPSLGGLYQSAARDALQRASDTPAA